MSEIQQNAYACKYCGWVIFDTGDKNPTNNHKCAKCGATAYVLVSSKETYENRIKSGSLNSLLMERCKPYESKWYKHNCNLTPTSGEKPEYLIENNQQPHCPTCGSTKVRYISSVERGANAVAFGFLGNKRKKQFECLNCKYMW